MLYCDSKDLVEYELIDKDQLKRFATREYLDNAERSVFRHIESFENVVVSISFDHLLRYVDLLKKSSLIVFVKLSKTFVKEKSTIANAISYDLRTSELEKMSTITICVKKTDKEFVANKIMEKIGEML